MFKFKGRLTVIGYTDEMKINELKSKVSNDALVFIDAKEDTSYQPKFCLIGDNGKIVSQMFINDIRLEAQRNQKAALIFTKLKCNTQQKAILEDFKTIELAEHASYVFGFTDTGGEILKYSLGHRRAIQMEELHYPLLFI